MHSTEFQKYIDSEKRYSVHTVTSYIADLNQFILFLSKEYQIEKVTEVSFPIVRSWVALLLEEGLTPRSVNRKISTLKTYFNFLLQNLQFITKPSNILAIILTKFYPIICTIRLSFIFFQLLLIAFLNETHNHIYILSIK